MRAWSSAPRHHERHTIEVKVSRTDLRNELADLTKSEPFDAVSHRFYLAVPAGPLREEDQIPAHWGIYEIGERGGVRRTRKGTRNNDPAPLPERAFVEAFRRAWRGEARIRDAEANGDAAAQAADLRRQVAALTTSRDSARRASHQAKSDLSNLVAAIAGGAGWWCVCGKATTRHQSVYAVKHADGTPCSDSRYGSASLDYYAIARALGVDISDAEVEPSAPTAREQLIEVRAILERNDATAKTLSAVREVLLGHGSGSAGSVEPA